MQIFLFLLLFVVPGFARGSFQITEGSGAKPLNESSYTAQEGFAVSQKGIPLFGLIIQFNDTRFQRQDLIVQNGEAVVSAGPGANNPGRIRYVIGGDNASISDQQGNILTRIRWKPARRGVFYQKCQTPAFTFRIDKRLENVPFPVAMVCDLTNTPPRFAVSVPEEVEWLDSNLNEVGGKGERSRWFELPSGNLKTEEVGFFRFKFGTQTYSFPISIRTLSEKQEQGRAGQRLGFDKILSLGSASMTYAGDGTGSAGGGFMVKFSGLTDAFWSRYKFGVHFKNTFSMSDDPKAITLSDIGLSMGYYKDSDTFSYGAYGQYRSLDYRAKETNARLQSTQFGFGFAANYRFGAKSKVTADLSMANLGSKIVKSHMNYAIGYSRMVLLSEIETWMGVQMDSQTTQGAGSGEVSGKFEDTSILMTFQF